MKFILGKKIGMSQIFDEDNKVVPITLIEAGPCSVVQVKTEEKDGYQAVRIGFEEIKEKKMKKPQKGHLKKAKLEKNYRYLKEFESKDLKVGDVIDVSVFEKGDEVGCREFPKGKDSRA